MYTLFKFIFKMNNQQEPTIQHKDLCSMLCGSLMVGKVEGEWIHVYVWLGLQGDPTSPF